MGLLINGQWQDEWYDTEKTDGKFERESSQFDHYVQPNSSQRYLLYVSLACPWAHRALIMRELKGLQEHIPVVVVSTLMEENGWSFAPDEGADKDPTLDARYLYQLYQKANPTYSGRVTIPMLWDTHEQTIVNNESVDIMRMFNSSFSALQSDDHDYYPATLKTDIDEINNLVYNNINNGVYKAGFASTQAAYEEAVHSLFSALDQIELRLQTQRYLCGNTITEADWRLFTTLVRFDSVYYGHFKCNVRRIIDYPALGQYVRDLYQQPGIATTVNMSQIKNHYYRSHPTINPNGIVPVGPEIDFYAAHQRHNF